MKTSDMEYIAMESNHVTGLPIYRGGSGDPSPVTAYGTYVGMKAMAKMAYGNESLMDKKIWDKRLLEDLCQVMEDASICGLGQAAPNPIRLTLKHFSNEVLGEV